MWVLIELDSSDREGLNILGHWLSHILFLHDNFVLELAIPSCIEGGKSVDVDTEQALKWIKEEDMLHLNIVFSRQDLVSVAHEVGNDCVTIITAGCQDLAALLHCHGVASLFVLFHYVSYRTLCVLWCVLVVDEHFSAHWNRDDPS